MMVKGKKTAAEDRDNAAASTVKASTTGKRVYRVRVVHSNATEYGVCKDGLNVEKGDHIIVPTRYGKDLGRIQGIVSNLLEVGSSEILTIERKVEEPELKKQENNRERDMKAFDVCREKIREHNLEMKLVSAHHLFGEPKILFFFTADSRVDFRELVKDLVSIFRIRIELRQIGVRDESRVIGGMGVCGRGYCCHTLTDKLNPVSIKMAKKQNLSLNSLKISGPCGRLLCCLSYEYPFYEEAKGRLPSEGMRISFEGEVCRIMEINVLSKEVKLRGDNGRTFTLPVERFHYSDRKRKWEVEPQDTG